MITSAMNYHTSYAWKINNGEYSYRRNAACFASLYSDTRQISHKRKNNGCILVKIYFDKKSNANRVDNYCLLNEAELKKYFHWIKKITGFNLKLSDDNRIAESYEIYNYKIIKVQFLKRSAYEIKLICALIRNLYECPYNIMVKSAFLMKDLEEFKHLDFSQRLSVVVNSISEYNTGHSVFSHGGTLYYNDKLLKERYLTATESENNVNQFMLYNKYKDIEFNRYDYYQAIKEDEDEDDYETIFDTLEEDYISNEFKDILIGNYKIIKENYG